MRLMPTPEGQIEFRQVVMRRFWPVVVLLCWPVAAHADCVSVKYREGACVPLDKFECKKTVSSFVNEVCYDGQNKYMLILLNTTWYHYCNIPQGVVTALEGAESVGPFYNSDVKGKYGCQGQSVPNY
jgi:hypothetical protein